MNNIAIIQELYRAVREKDYEALIRSGSGVVMQRFSEG
jgi:hypothetical protein